MVWYARILHVETSHQREREKQRQRETERDKERKRDGMTHSEHRLRSLISLIVLNCETIFLISQIT